MHKVNDVDDEGDDDGVGYGDDDDDGDGDGNDDVDNSNIHQLLCYLTRNSNMSWNEKQNPLS